MTFPSCATRLSACLAALTVVAAACGDDEPGAAGSTPTATVATTVPTTVAGSATAPAAATTEHEVPAPEGATEHPEPVPRLVLADAETGAIEVLDVASGETLATIDVTGPSSLATDGRFVYATDHEGGAVTVIDGGSWVVDHGDHVHAYTADVGTLGELEGDRPAHVIPNDGVTSVFFDGTGTADLLRHSDLEAGELAPVATLHTPMPHHGVVVAFDGHYAVSIPGPTSDDLPVGIEVRHDDAEVEAAFPDWPELHGEAGFGDGALFACADGVLWVSGVEGEWTAEKLAYPDGTPAGDRTWSFAHAHDVPVVGGILGETAVLMVDTASWDAHRVELPATPVAVAVADDGASLVALTDDGTLHLIDAQTATVTASAPVLDTVLDGEEDPQPNVVVEGSRAYVSDPVARAVVEVALNDGLRVTRSFATDVTPRRMVLTGAA